MRVGASRKPRHNHPGAQPWRLKQPLTGADHVNVRLTATLPRATAARRRRSWVKRFDGPPPALAVELVDGVLRVLDSSADHDQVLATATAFGVLRAQQGNAIGSLLDDIASLRELLSQRRGGPNDHEAVALVDALLAAASTGYVEELTAILQSRATRDPLTGLPNRAAFTEVLSHEIAGAHRGQPPALLLVDLDGFKGVNDTDGHLAGDAVLRGVADVLTAAGRRSDVSCRLGGDEFAVVLPRSTQRQAMHAARRLLAAAREAGNLSSPSARVTLSLGVGWLPDPASVEELVAVADAALYRVKAAGGNDVDASRPDDRPAAPA